MPGQDTEKNIEAFIEKYHLRAHVDEGRNTSKLHPLPGRCYQLWLEYPERQKKTIFHVYTGQFIDSMTTAAALWNLVETAETYQELDTYERWNHEHDGYYEKELGRATAKMYYHRSKKVFEMFQIVLGEDLYRELASLVYE